MINPIYNINISFDFDLCTKNKYFTQVDASGCDFVIFNSCSNNSFYEIANANSILLGDTSFSLNEFKNPFTYIKNNGTGSFPICLSKNNICSSESIDFNESYYENKNICLYPQESILITTDASQEGNLGISKTYIPFGFKFNFQNIEEINPLGCYPMQFICDISTFSYLSEKNKNVNFYDKSNLEIELDFSGICRNLCCIESSSSKFLGSFEENKSGYLRNKNYCNSFDFQCEMALLNTCFYINKLPNSGKKYHLYSLGNYNVNDYESKFNIISINENGQIEVGETSGYCHSDGEANPCRIITCQVIQPCSWNNLSLIKNKNFGELLVNENYYSSLLFKTGFCTNLINLSNSCDLNSSQVFDGCISNFKIVNDSRLHDSFASGNGKYSVDLNLNTNEYIYMSENYFTNLPSSASFTIDFWIYLCGFRSGELCQNQSQTILDSRASGIGPGLYLAVCYSTCGCSCTSGWSINSCYCDVNNIETEIRTGIWHHVYLQRKNCYRTLATRSEICSAIESMYDNLDYSASEPIYIGSDNNTLSNLPSSFYGLISNLRIITGCAIYEADYYYPQFPLNEVVCRSYGGGGYGDNCCIPSCLFSACLFGPINSDTNNFENYASGLLYKCCISAGDLNLKLKKIASYPETCVGGIRSISSKCANNLIAQIPSSWNDLYVDFDLRNYLSSGLAQNINSFIDSGICLGAELKTNNLNFCSKFGNHFYDSCIKINCLSIYKDSEYFESRCEAGIDWNVCEKISTDLNYCILYNFDLIKNKNYRYSVNLSGSDSSNSNLEIYSTCNSDIQLITGINKSGIVDFFTSDGYSYVCAKLQKNDSIKDLNLKQVCLINFYFPEQGIFDFDHCYTLKDSNKLNSGIFSWIDTGSNYCQESGCIYSNSIEENNINIINCSDEIFIQNKPNCNYINLCISNNRCSISDIYEKQGENTTEEFLLLYGNYECSYFYENKEYKYFPALAVCYRNNFYQLPDSNVNYSLNINNCNVNLELPIRAIDNPKLKVVSDFEIIDTVNYVCQEIYFDNLRYSKKFTEEFALPIPQVKYLDCYVSPSVSVSSEVNSLIQNSVKFYVNFTKNDEQSSNYGLNNLFNYIKSKYNSGLANDFSSCELQYGSDEYNLLMAQLEQESISYSCSAVSGGWSEVNNALNFSNYIYNQPVCYKSLNGIGCNFILPVIQSLNYVDKYYDKNLYQQTGSLFFNSGINNKIISNSYLSHATGYDYLSGTGYIYDYGTGNICTSGIGTIYETGTGYIYDMNEFGEITGCHTGEIQIETTGWIYSQYTGYIVTGCHTGDILTGIINYYATGGSFYKNLDFYSFNLSSDALNYSTGNRDINISKNYSFSGIYPVYIQSNYGLNQIKHPLTLCNLDSYASSFDSFSGIFYYFYNFSNYKNNPLVFLSHPSAAIQSASWNDTDGDKCISLYKQNKIDGSLKDTVSLLNVNFSGVIFDNQKTFEESLINLNLNMIGGL